METIVITKRGKGDWSVDRVTPVGTWHIGSSKTRKGAEGWVRVYESWKAAGLV